MKKEVFTIWYDPVLLFNSTLRPLSILIATFDDLKNSLWPIVRKLRPQAPKIVSLIFSSILEFNTVYLTQICALGGLPTFYKTPP